MRYSRILAAGASALALAGVVAAGAASASAAPAAPATTVSAHYQYQRPWQLNGHNTVSLTYLGSTWTYKVQFSTQYNYGQPPWAQKDQLLTGKLTDTGLPAGQQTLQVNGVIFGNYVVFSVVYPANSVGQQGVRTFSGTIDKHGNVTGSWTETGTEAGSGPFTLLAPAHK